MFQTQRRNEAEEGPETRHQSCRAEMPMARLMLQRSLMRAAGYGRKDASASGNNNSSALRSVRSIELAAGERRCDDLGGCRRSSAIAIGQQAEQERKSTGAEDQRGRPSSRIFGTSVQIAGNLHPNRSRAQPQTMTQVKMKRREQVSARPAFRKLFVHRHTSAANRAGTDSRPADYIRF